MFTGLVETVGELCGRSLNGNAGKLRIKPHQELKHPLHGESIAVNGTCLTLEHTEGEVLVFHAMQETFARTNLGSLPVGSLVNLERAMAVGDRFGGHLVSGHVDGVGTVASIQRKGDDIELKLNLPGSVIPYLVPKGSICIDGISLTVAALGTDFLTVHLIPVTWNETNLRFRSPGDEVNLEADVIGKYVRHQLAAMLGHPDPTQTSSAKGEIQLSDLLDAGF